MSAVAINIEKKNVKCGRMQLVSVENYIVKSTVGRYLYCIQNISEFSSKMTKTQLPFYRGP